MASTARAVALLKTSAAAVRESSAFSPGAQISISAKLERLAKDVDERGSVAQADAAAAACCLFPACPDVLREAVAELERLAMSSHGPQSHRAAVARIPLLDPTKR